MRNNILTPELKAVSGTVTYKGYFNYWLIKDSIHWKTTHFQGKTKKQVDKLRAGFMGVQYGFIGEKIWKEAQK